MADKQISVEDLIKRLRYWRSKDLRNGWTTIGPCCEDCLMTNPKNPLQGAVGCRDPFQINCECHLPVRRAVRGYMVCELEAIIKRLDPDALKDDVPTKEELTA